MSIRLPMTATQLARQTGMGRDDCSYVLSELTRYGSVCCLNPQARRSRLYWLTQLGKDCQRGFQREQGHPLFQYAFPIVDWDLYGWVCFSHRAAVLLALHEAMQPARIKRVARSQNPELRMSANNVRDVIKLLLERGIVELVPGRRKRSHPLCRLTLLGSDFRELLRRVEVPA